MPRKPKNTGNEAVERALDKGPSSTDRHPPECVRHDAPDRVNERMGFVDMFRDRHDLEAPRPSGNGDVLWPAGWTAEMASRWRKEHNLTAPQTWWEGSDGFVVHLVTTDPEVSRRAAASTTEPQTFVYWTGEKQDAITGVVEAMCQDGRALRFSLVPQEAGARAI